MDILNKLCRACLTTKESFTHFFFEDISPDTYWFCTSLKIEEDDQLPRALCSQCYDLLTRFSEFKTKCMKTHDILQLYQNGKTNVLKEIEIFLDDVKPVISVKEEQNADKYDNEYNGDSENIPSPVDCCHKKVSGLKVFQRKRKETHKLNSKVIKTSSRKSKKQIYSCEHCTKRFSNEFRFETHKQIHEGKKLSFHCLLCSKTFSSMSGIRRHNRNIHIKVRLSGLTCSVCGLVCSSRDALREHQKGHATVGVDCMCHVCGRKLSSQLVLKSHLETHNGDRERLYTCEHCGKKFFTNKSLQAHISRQHTNRRYICAHCNYPFTDKHNLIKHIRVHEGKRPYLCDVCEKSFSVHSSLVEHKRIHSGERPFECAYCSKNFLSKRRLIDHHRIHTGEKPHKCAVCENRFTQRGTLLRHMKMHNKVVPVTK